MNTDIRRVCSHFLRIDFDDSSGAQKSEHTLRDKKLAFYPAANFNLQPQSAEA